MKIAQVVCVYPPYKGGIGTAAKNFYHILKTKHEVVNFSLQKNSPETKYLQPWMKLGHGALDPFLFKKLKSFEAVYLHYPFFGVHEFLFFWKIFYPQKKLFIYYHMDTGRLPFFKKILSSPGKILEKLLIKKADKIIVSSLDYLRSGSWNKYYQKWPEKFFSLPFGVDTEFFKPLEKKEENSIPQILFTGGMDKAHYFKGVPELLKALSSLDFPWQLQLVGQGSLTKKYQILAKDLGIEKKVFFLGGRDHQELKKLYQQADLFVLPSINSHEAFGIVLLEAMACGTPVVASRLPGVRTVFQDGIQGFYSEPKNIPDLKEKITLALEKRNFLKTQTRLWIMENYRLEKTKEKLLQIFNL